MQEASTTLRFRRKLAVGLVGTFQGVVWFTVDDYPLRARFEQWRVWGERPYRILATFETFCDFRVGRWFANAGARRDEDGPAGTWGRLLK